MKLVSVFIITYNHEKYIGETIESIVSQKVNFDFEIVIGEDSSKDNTRAICEKYAAKYPNIIKLLPSDRNYGPMGNTIRTLNACDGKYIAMCEGDDYWADPYKLQKQVDFLESHPDFSICFSQVEIKDELGWNWPDEKYFPEIRKEDFTIEDFILSEMNIIPTPTILFRNILPRPLPAFFEKQIAGDMIIQLLVADKGKAYCFKEKMAVYRNHAGGATKSPKTIENGENALIESYKFINKYLGLRYDGIFKKRFLEIYRIRLIYGSKEKEGYSKLVHYFKNFPKYIRYSDRINLKEIMYYHTILFFPSLLKIKK